MEHLRRVRGDRLVFLIGSIVQDMHGWESDPAMHYLSRLIEVNLGQVSSGGISGVSD